MKTALEYRPVAGQFQHGNQHLPGLEFQHVQELICGPGSSVCIAIDYGLDGPGSNPDGDEIFRPFRPALGPTQLPVKWVPGLSRG